MFHIALYQPEIPPNTGNIIRLCANTGSQLHLIHPLGFEITDKHLRRAGLDYREWVNMQEYANFEDFLAQPLIQKGRMFACSTKGKQRYDQVAYQAGDVFLFGPETRGLPEAMLLAFQPERILRIPMRPDNRSLNLSNAAAVMVYEAWRQLDFL
ncbi:MAG: tRNA (cytidine(34)-2'-O)-methyltransferase [Gammaproteobacteria bacterium]